MESWITIVIYLLAGISIFLAIGGLNAYSATKDKGLLLSSFVSIGFSTTAIILPHWWPLVAGFVINMIIAKVFPRFAYTPMPEDWDAREEDGR